MPVFKIGETIETDESTVEVTSNEREFLPPGTHTFQLTVVDDSGNASAPAVFKVVVRDTQRPTAVLVGPEAVEFGRSFKLDGTRSTDIPPGKIVKYQWSLLGRV